MLLARIKDNLDHGNLIKPVQQSGPDLIVSPMDGMSRHLTTTNLSLQGIILGLDGREMVVNVLYVLE